MAHEQIDYVQLLHHHGYRVTPQRLLVLDAVCILEGHATMPRIQAQVYDFDPTISRSTVYRALDILCKTGLITATAMGELGTVYAISGASDHHHLVCCVCGSVSELDPQLMQPLQAHIQALYGFIWRPDHAALRGYCRQCAATQTAK